MIVSTEGSESESKKYDLDWTILDSDHTCVVGALIHTLLVQVNELEADLVSIGFNT